MAAKSKTSSTTTSIFRKGGTRKLKRHTKTKTNNKCSKNYKKKYAGQGGR